jgi:hypothetical protein
MPCVAKLTEESLVCSVGSHSLMLLGVIIYRLRNSILILISCGGSVKYCAVTLRVIVGDEKGSLESGTVNFWLRVP